MSDSARYILAKKIARGGMAEIFLGKQVGEDGFQRLCAIKRILPHYAQDKEFIEMFRDEAHIGKRLQHANIVRVEGFEEVDGAFAIIMEFVDGSDLRSLLSACEKANQRLSVASSIFVTAEVARGLHYAHTKIDEVTQKSLDIVHRDISPQNILLSYEGEVKVTDFGIAQAESKLTETKPGIVKGKYAYMSPEHISGKQVDGRTDVFALAVVLWEMLAMRRLFSGETEVETIQLVKNCKIPFKLRDLNPEVDEELENIVHKALAKDIRKRHANGAEFERDLRRYLSQKFSNFTPGELGTFLKQVLASRRDEQVADIKKTLTDPNLKPSTKTGRKIAGSSSEELAASAPQLSLAPTSAYNGNNDSLRQQGNPAFNVAANGPRTGYIGGNTAGPGRVPHSAARNASANWTGARKVRRSMGLLSFMVIALIAIGIGYGLFQLSENLNAKDPAKIVIQSTPPTVRLTLDGHRLFGGNFRRTPVGLQMPPGKHTLLLERPGYESDSYTFTGESGRTLRKSDFVLKATSTFAPTKIMVGNFGSFTRARLEVNGGFAITTVSPNGNNTMILRDVAEGRPHMVKIITGTAGDSDATVFACRFTPRSNSWRNPAVLTVDLVVKACTLKNP